MYKKNRHIHFIGIGGIGMSGIAAILRQQGYVVSGCDVVQNTPILVWLQKLGCEIHTGHHEKHVEKADVLVYSSAIDENHGEIKAASRTSEALEVGMDYERMRFADYFRLTGRTKPSTFTQLDTDASSCLGMYELLKK